MSCFLHLSLRSAPLRQMLLCLTLGKLRMSMTSLWCHFSCPWGTWEAEFPHALQCPRAPSWACSKAVMLLKPVSHPLTSASFHEHPSQIYTSNFISTSGWDIPSSRDVWNMTVLPGKRKFLWEAKDLRVFTESTFSPLKKGQNWSFWNSLTCFPDLSDIQSCSCLANH